MKITIDINGLTLKEAYKHRQELKDAAASFLAEHPEIPITDFDVKVEDDLFGILRERR